MHKWAYIAKPVIIVDHSVHKYATLSFIFLKIMFSLVEEKWVVAITNLGKCAKNEQSVAKKWKNIFHNLNAQKLCV